MSTQRDVAVLVGNLQEASQNRMLAQVFVEISPPALKLEIVEIGNLPLYNQDKDDNPPAVWRDFRTRLKAASAVLFVTPEHLRSVPAVLMNALDVGSMPYDKSVWDGKPAAIAGVSTGTIGPFNNHRHLREALTFLRVLTLQKPEVYLAGVESLFNDQGHLTSQGTQALLMDFLKAFAAWIDKNMKQ